MTRILIAGGYGLIGSTIARHIRTISKDVEIVLAGRTPENGAALAGELGGASTAYLDVADAQTVGDLGAADLVVSALYDPGNALIDAALAHGVAHIGITTKAEDVAAIAFAALRTQPKRPIVLAGYCAAGVLMPVAQKAAEQFRRIDSVAVTALFDPSDPVGPMTAHDAQYLVARALLRRNGVWEWVEGVQHGRSVRIADADMQVFPTSVLDVPGLAAMTGAANVRLDIAQGNSVGTRAGGRASSDALIDIEGTLQSGAPGRRRTIVSDPNGLAHLTALSVAVAAERVLGLDGRAPAPGGLHLPETLLSPDAAIARFEQFGVRITSEEESAL